MEISWLIGAVIGVYGAYSYASKNKKVYRMQMRRILVILQLDNL